MLAFSNQLFALTKFAASVREPQQVFSLLETLYAAFDEIAGRRRVFKVETIGDCYVRYLVEVLTYIVRCCCLRQLTFVNFCLSLRV